MLLGCVFDKKHQSGMVYSICGVFPTICSGTHGYSLGYILYKKENL